MAFSAGANPNNSTRSGTLTIAGQSFIVTQAAAPCNYVLSSNSTTVASDGASSSFTFSTAANGCTSTALSYSNWITATTTSTPDGVSGTVNFTVAPNTAGTIRVGTIQLAGQSFSITQTAAACSFSLNAYGLLYDNAGVVIAGAGSPLLGSASALGCSPTVGVDQPSIVTLGPLTGPVSNIWTQPFTVLPFSSVVANVRRANLSFGGQVLVIKQRSW